MTPAASAAAERGARMQAGGVETTTPTIIGSMPATNAAGIAAASSDITVDTSSMTSVAKACAAGSAD